MSAPVDVLAVMDAAARSLWIEGQPVNPHAADLISARAAVAKLIEAADNALVALGRYAEEIDGDSGDCLNLEQLLANGGEPEYVALRDALARVRGAA